MCRANQLGEAVKLFAITKRTAASARSDQLCRLVSLKSGS